MIAKQYGQDPRTVAAWEPDWIAAAMTVISAENAAANERQRRDERRSKMRQGRGGR